MTKETKELGIKSITIFIGNIFGRALEFGSLLLIGRYLGAGVYGEYVFILSFLTIFSILTKLGIDTGLVSFLSRDTVTQKEKNSLVSFGLLFSVSIALVLIVLLSIFGDGIMKHLLNDFSNGSLYYSMLPFILLISVKNILISVTNGYRRVRERIIVNNFFVPISRLILVSLLIFAFNVDNFLAVVVPHYVYLTLSIIFLLYVVIKKGYIGKINKNFNNMTLVLFSLPLLFSSVIYTLSANIDKYMIGTLIDSTQVGIYRVALQIAGLSTFALVALNTIFGPMISKLYHNEEFSKMKNLYRNVTKWITLFNVSVLAFISLFGSDVLELFGKEFKAGYDALLVVTIGFFISSLVGSVGIINIMTEKQVVPLISNLTALIANVILNIILIGSYGIVGAAVATSVSFSIRNLINFIYMYSRLRMHPFDWGYIKLFVSVILASLTTYLISGSLDYHLVINLAIQGILYLTLLVLFTLLIVFSKEDVNQLKKTIMNRGRKNDSI